VARTSKRARKLCFALNSTRGTMRCSVEKYSQKSEHSRGKKRKKGRWQGLTQVSLSAAARWDWGREYVLGLAVREELGK